MHSMFSTLLPQHVFAEAPPPPGADLGPWTASFTTLVEAHADELAGVVVEPVLQGAGGMYAYDPACLRIIRDVVDRLGQIGRAHVCTPVPNAHLVCRLLLEKTKTQARQ